MIEVDISLNRDCNEKWTDPLDSIAVCIYYDHNASWRSSIAANPLSRKRSRNTRYLLSERVFLRLSFFVDKDFIE